MSTRYTDSLVTLICLPFAGGGVGSFDPLRAHLPQGLQLLDVGLPGRGVRYCEPLEKDVDALVEDIWRQLKGRVTSSYALLGHSMGSLLAYLLCHKIIEAGLHPPLHLFLTGREAPSVAQKDMDHLLPYADFKAKLVDMGGFPDELLQDEDVFAFFEPILRADFQAIETWQYRRRQLLDVPATVITGTEEDLTEEEILGWREEFSTAPAFEKIQGGHFFLFEKAEAFTSIIKQRLFDRQLNTTSNGHS